MISEGRKAIQILHTDPSLSNKEIDFKTCMFTYIFTYTVSSFTSILGSYYRNVSRLLFFVRFLIISLPVSE